MTLQEFKESLQAPHCPTHLNKPLQALWQDGNCAWDKAHEIAQSIDDTTGAWVHAYLHRKEGDHANASYWYRRAGKAMPTSSLATEWAQIANALLITDKS